MNNYPSWWDTTITIYNRYEDKQTNLVTWFRHKVDGAFWKYTGDKVVINNTVLETKNIICRIRKDDAFLEKHEWIAIPNDQMSNYFTLSQGDIIVKGEVNDEIDEYVSGKRSTDLKKKYKDLQGCVEIQEWSNNTGGGRGNEHYFVKGI
ncbi:hypothetical protein J6O48_08505 [bacterium]|nr:hypothetical protein [bacterium]